MKPNRVKPSVLSTFWNLQGGRGAKRLCIPVSVFAFFFLFSCMNPKIRPHIAEPFDGTKGFRFFHANPRTTLKLLARCKVQAVENVKAIVTRQDAWRYARFTREQSFHLANMAMALASIEKDYRETKDTKAEVGKRSQAMRSIITIRAHSVSQAILKKARETGSNAFQTIYWDRPTYAKGVTSAGFPSWRLEAQETIRFWNCPADLAPPVKFVKSEKTSKFTETVILKNGKVFRNVMTVKAGKSVIIASPDGSSRVHSQKDIKEIRKARN